jgi:hypothetical protein
MPVDPPVITATLPSSFPTIGMPAFWSWIRGHAHPSLLTVVVDAVE